VRRFRYAAFGDTLVYLNGHAKIDAYNMLNGAIDIYGDTNYSAPVETLDSITASEMTYAQANSNAPAGLILTGGAFYDPVTKRLRASGSSTSITMRTVCTPAAAR
jgi:hypothetical protein